jgi:hypothetical protein
MVLLFFVNIGFEVAEKVALFTMVPIKVVVLFLFFHLNMAAWRSSLENT